VADVTDVDVGLKRALGSVSATCIVIGAIVGVGIFFTPSRVAAVTGSADLAMWCWALGGLGALLGGLVFAELGGMYGKTGGQYEILSDAYNPLVAFCFVFCNSTAVLAGAAAIIAIICAENLGVMVNGAAPDARTVTWMSVVMIAGLAGANVIGVRWGAMIQNITVFAKLTTLLIVTALAAFAAPQVVAEASMSNAADPGGVAVAPLLFAGLVPALFSFGGWQHALWIGGEVKNPKRNVPLAIVAGVLIVIVVYLLANWAYFALLGYGGVVGSKALAADAVSVVWPDIGARMVAAAVAFSAFGVLNAQLLSGPRLLCGMARHGRFFRPFAHVHPRHGTPFPAIALIASIGLGLALIAGKDGINQLLTGVVLVDAVFFFLTGLALLILRKRRPDHERPLRVPLYPLVPILFLAFECVVIFGAFQDRNTLDAALIGVAWMVAAVVCFFLFFARRGERESKPGESR